MLITTRLAALFCLGAILVISPIAVQPASADAFWRYVDVHCSQIDKRVSIELRYQWNEQRTLEWHGQIRPTGGADADQHFKVTDQIDYGECFLGSGVPVRVKILDTRA